MQNKAIFCLFWAFFAYFTSASPSVGDLVNEIIGDTSSKHARTKFVHQLEIRLKKVSKKFGLDKHRRLSQKEALKLHDTVEKASGEHTIYSGGSTNDEITCIHVVPQSFFSPYTSQKVIDSDLHNIYISQSINFDDKKTYKGVYKFTEVPNAEADMIYNGSVKGVNDAEVAHNISKYGCKISTKSRKFEPNDEAKGRVARTCAYIITRYNWLLPKMEELIDINTMVDWHEKFPPTKLEIEREAEIFKEQGNHNPYITQPVSYMREVWLSK